MVYNRYEMIMRKNAVRDSRYEYNITGSCDAYDFCRDILHLQEYPEEHFVVLGISACGDIVGFFEVSKGDLGSTTVSPREVFRPVIGGMPASSILCAHNHPSGSETPSSEDIRTTERLMEAGKILGIPVIDHLIIGEGRFTSLRAAGYMKE